MAQIVHITAAREAKTRAESCGIARLTQWKPIPDGRKERKEWAEMRAGRAKPFQFPMGRVA